MKLLSILMIVGALLVGHEALALASCAAAGNQVKLLHNTNGSSGGSTAAPTGTSTTTRTVR